MLRRPRDRHPAPRLCDRDLATTWQVVSLLLDYPDEELLGRVSVVRQAVDPLHASVREPVCRFLAYLGSAPLTDLQRAYVETFDVTRRCCLYLTYFAHGDTRKRGLALVLSLHDLEQAASLAQRVAVMHRGRLYAAGAPEACIGEEMLRDVFGVDAQVSKEDEQLRIRVRGPADPVRAL